MNWFLFWLLLHIAAAIIAFGPIFVFPLMEPTVKARPGGLPFSALLSEKMERGLIVPVALTMLVSGFGMVITLHLNFFANYWLLAAIVLYLAALAIAFLNQMPVTGKLVKLTENPGPPGPPSPEILALLQRNKIGGMIQTAMLIIIIFLMVIRPGGVVAG